MRELKRRGKARGVLTAAKSTCISPKLNEMHVKRVQDVFVDYITRTHNFVLVRRPSIYRHKHFREAREAFKATSHASLRAWGDSQYAEDV